MNRVWTFILGRQLSENELADLISAGKAFVSQWTAHNNQLFAEFEIFRNRIIIVKVNETVSAASGCSIDKLTRFMKETEKQFNTELMNRLLVAYKNSENDLQVIPSSQIKELVEAGTITAETIVYNTAISNENELNDWEQPLSDTWLAKYLRKV